MNATAHKSSPSAHGHISSMPMLVGVFVVLLGLTILTVAIAYIDLGEFNLFVALGIATLKASLVALFFMHLAYDSGFNRLAFFSSFFFVSLFVGFTLLDTSQYQPTLDWQEKVLKSAPDAQK